MQPFCLFCASTTEVIGNTMDIWCVLLQICTVPTTVKVIWKYFSKCFGWDVNSYFWLF